MKTAMQELIEYLRSLAFSKCHIGMGDIMLTQGHIDELEESFYKMLASRSNQTEEFWIKACRKDFYMTAAKALEYGIIDEII